MLTAQEQAELEQLRAEYGGGSPAGPQPKDYGQSSPASKPGIGDLAYNVLGPQIWNNTVADFGAPELPYAGGAATYFPKPNTLSPEEQAELAQLRGQFERPQAQAPHEPSFLKRSFQQIANAPVNALQGLVDMVQPGVPDEYKAQYARPYEEREIGGPSGLREKIADVAFGQFLPMAASTAVPFTAGMKAAQAFGASARMALTAGDVAAGIGTANATNNPYAIPEFMAFGALRGLPLAGRVAGGYGTSLAAQGLAGQNPFTVQGQGRALADTLFAAIDTPQKERSLRTLAREAPEPSAPSGPIYGTSVIPTIDEVSNAFQNKRPTYDTPIIGGEPIPRAKAVIDPTTAPAKPVIAPENVGQGPRSAIAPEAIQTLRSQLGDVKSAIERAPLAERVRLTIAHNEILRKLEGADEFQRTTAQQGGELGFRRQDRNVLAELPESMEPDWSSKVRSKIEARSKQGGFIDPSIVDDLAQAGKRVFQAGMDKAAWAAQMIKEFGDGIRQFLDEAWNRVTKGTDPQWTERMYQAARSPDTGTVGRAALNFLSSFRDSPPEVREILTRRQGVVGETVSDFKDAFKDAASWVGKMTPEQLETGRQYATGQIDEAAFMARPDFTPEMKATLRQGKEITANLQRKLLQGEANPQRRAMIARTIGDHVSRMYDIHVNPGDWKKDPQAFDSVVSEWAGQFGGDREVTGKMLDEYLYQAKTGDAFPQNVSAGKQVKIGQNIYLKRLLTEQEKASRMRELGGDLQAEQSKSAPDSKVISEIQEEIKAVGDSPVLTDSMRKLLGERTNPVEAQARTIAKLTQAAANSQAIRWFDDLDLDGMRASMTPEEYGAALKNQPDNAMLRAYVPLPDTAGYGRMAGKLAHPEVARGMEAFAKAKEGFTEAIEKSVIGTINSQIKQNLTVRNPGTSARNYLTTPMFLLAARNFNPREWVAALGELRGKSGQHFEEARKNGILGADQVSQEFIRNIEDAISVKPSGVFKPFKSFDEFLKRVYQQPDRFTRYVTYRNARLRGMSESQAIRFTDRYTHNYGSVPKGVKTMRNLPFFNPFISYNYEMFRVMKNLAQDVANKQLPVSERMTSAGVLVGLATAPLAIKAGIESMLPEKDREEWEKMMRLSPAMQRGQIRIPFGKDEKGNFNYLNADPFAVAGDYTKILRNLWNGDFEAIAADNPIVGFRNTPLLNVAAELASGKELFSGKPIPKTIGGTIDTVVRNTAPPLAGGFAGREMVKSFTPNKEGGLGITDSRTGRTYSPGRFLPTLAGVRVAQQNPRNVIRSAQLEQREKTEEKQRSLREILRTNRTPEAKERAIREFQEGVREDREEMARRLKR